jgi:hypothetical protein
MTRYKNFKLWYKHLRQQGVKLHGKEVSTLPYYAKYSIWNCFLWAITNSSTHHIDGSYFK